jgi:ABC-type antimicrobial peptide transport system permease subunit
MALGAERRHMLADAVASGATLVGIGVVVGTLLSLGVGRVLRSLLFEVQPDDVVSLTVSVLVLSTVGLLASYAPARLVLRVDPAIALREEA